MGCAVTLPRGRRCGTCGGRRERAGGSLRGGLAKVERSDPFVDSLSVSGDPRFRIQFSLRTLPIREFFHPQHARQF